MPSTVSIETERLLLRPVTKEDLDEVVRLHEDPEVARFMGTPDRQWLEEWVEGSDGEAACAVLEWSRQFDLPYVTAMIRPDNAPSLAVAKRLGLTPLREDELLGVPVVVHATAH